MRHFTITVQALDILSFSGAEAARSGRCKGDSLIGMLSLLRFIKLKYCRKTCITDTMIDQKKQGRLRLGNSETNYDQLSRLNFAKSAAILS